MNFKSFLLPQIISEQQNGMFLSLKNQRSTIPCGKCLGGSSSIHSLYYTRGDARDYQEWGYEAFKFENILNFFKKSEFITDSSRYNDYHGTRGPFVIQPSPHVVATFDMVGRVCEERYHISSLPDINTGKTLGYAHYDLYMDSSRRRVSSYTAYIKNRYKKTHNNLYILKNSYAVRLHVRETETPKPTTQSPGYNGSQNENNSLREHNELVLSSAERIQQLNSDSEGSDVDTIVEKMLKMNFVEIRIGDVTSKKIFRPKASKEIILAAGAINTPKLLLNSGIGPTQELLKKNIRQVKTLPVGYNYWDHVHFNGLVFRTNDESDYYEKRYGGGAG